MKPSRKRESGFLGVAPNGPEQRRQVPFGHELDAESNWGFSCNAVQIDSSYVSDATGGCFLKVRIVPRANSDLIQGLHRDALKLRLKAPPVDGKANARLLRLMSDWLNVEEEQLQIARGRTGREKLLFVQGLSAEEVRQALEAQVS